jgi:hypothetical protein
MACGARTPIDLSPGPPDDAGADTRRAGGVDASRGAPDTAPRGADALGPPDAFAAFDARLGRDSGLVCPDGGLPAAYLLDVTGAIYTFSPATLEAVLLGTPDCGTQASGTEPWTLSVSRDGTAYVVYEDWVTYAVNLTTLDCTPTTLQPALLGVAEQFAIAVSRTSGSEQLFVFGYSSRSNGPILASSNLTSFALSEVGPAVPTLPDTTHEYDMQADLFGHLYVFTIDGLLAELDATTGKVLGSDQTAVASGGTSWAVMTYQNGVYLFAGDEVARYDLASHEAVVLGSVQGTMEVVGASAVPCVGLL